MCRRALLLGSCPQNDIADVGGYQFWRNWDVKDVDVLYFRELLSGVWRLAQRAYYWMVLMKPYLSRLLEELGRVEKSRAAHCVV